MIIALSARYTKHIAALLFAVFYMELYASAHARYSEWEKNVAVVRPELVERHTPAIAQPTTANEQRLPPQSPVTLSLSKGQPTTVNFSGGPTQPEMNSFQSVNANNMVDLFSGDFSYNIPLLDVGGYPVNIAYHSGVSMDEDASWAGLGWNINPGSITRNMRGLPDDFNGGADTITKTASIKPNVNLGVSVGAQVGVEVKGFPLPLQVGASVGIFHTTYTGWGLETSMNATINGGENAKGPLSGGLSITNNSQSGLTLNPSLSANFKKGDQTKEGGFAMGLQLALPYNTRTGIKGLQLGLDAKKYSTDAKKMIGSGWNTTISFASPTYCPTISMPMTNYNFSFTGKVGAEFYTLHPNLSFTGYGGREYIADGDKTVSLPAFGYLNYQNMGNNWSALTDFNREKEIPYREKPAVPHIAVPAYTYDVFSISGEGTGGMFRAYRGDVGYIADHLNRSRTISGAASIDFGSGAILHGGTDLNANYVVTQSGPWRDDNALAGTIAFTQNQGLHEAAYFRNPGEKAINTTAFYDAIGGDDVVAATLQQAGSSSPSIVASNKLTRYSGKKEVGSVTMTPTSAIRNTRDKRSEVISYLTAEEASKVGLDKFIYHHAINQFAPHYCRNDVPEDAVDSGTGLMGYYFTNQELKGKPKYIRLDSNVFFHWSVGSPFWNDVPGNANGSDQSFPGDHFSVRWLGRLKPPVSGPYSFGVNLDDGIRLWINDSLVKTDWHDHGRVFDTCRVNLVGGQLYNIKIEFYDLTADATMQLGWRRPDRPPGFPFERLNLEPIHRQYLYPPKFSDTAIQVEDALGKPLLVREDRVNNFRKPNHISEMDVLNPDGRRYVYGIPVYNLQQKEASFNVNSGNGNVATGLTAYEDGKDNSTRNSNGKDGYFSLDNIPAYAHSFLLTGILSPDYVDVTGDGISDDDIGDAVKFNYAKTSGIANPFEWRAPYVTDSANYNEGLRTYNRDDKAHYIYGKKELWYLHSIESKTMVANFTLQPRADLLESDERGHKINNGKAMCVKQIDLYSKADFMAHHENAIPIKTVHFEYSYELCRGINYPVNDSGKLTLKRIWFTYNGNNKGVLNPYVFHYHNNNPRYGMNRADKWGAYKDPLSNPGSTTGNIINNAEYPYALQDSALAAYNAAAWALDSIRLPSGGRIKVNYESDDYAYVQNRRAAQMFKIAGFGYNTSGFNSKLYNTVYEQVANNVGGDQMYVFIKVPYTVNTKQELFERYLAGLTKLYFRLYLEMPGDNFGNGSEYVPCFAEPAPGNWYGIKGHDTIWIKVKGVNKTGDGDGGYSPLVQTALNYLRLNLSSKAYPGSEGSDELNLKDAIRAMISQLTNITDLITGFDGRARTAGWARYADLNRSFVRLNCPILKKYGGGLRVKSVLIYDNWNAMTGKKEAVYGQTYDYTTRQTINGVSSVISSGVASWEPNVGAEENPFHLPIEYVDRVSILAPAATLYSEEPLGETFYPSASIGYSNVRVRSIHSDKTRSANGYAETSFFTTYDFPTTWDWSMMDNNTKKRYKPFLSNFLRINAKNYLSISQGFKVELNDMNGKMRREATYAETDAQNPVTYTENFYHVDDLNAQVKHLNNTVAAIDPNGNINTAATIGKDVELMSDMREEVSTTIGGNVNIDVDLFTVGAIPVALPAVLGLYQHEVNQFRSAAITKIIQRYGIVDSVVHMDKGSKITSRNVLFDGETGDPLLVRTQNEFNDSLYEFSYPSHWAYKGTGPAYQNINASLSHLSVNNGRITGGLTQPDSVYLTAGDELLVYSKQTIDTSNCTNKFASFPNDYKLWVIDTNSLHSGPQQLFLVDQYGQPFSGNDVKLKVIRSGHRNTNGTVGSITSLGNPLVANGQGQYHLVFDSTTRVINAAASELRQYWKVGDKRRSDIVTNCIYTPQDSALAATQGCSCFKNFFDFLIQHHLLFIPKAARVTVGQLVNAAAAAGYDVSLSGCPILSSNAGALFYALSDNSTWPIYKVHLGNDIFDLRSASGLSINMYDLVSSTCDSLGRLHFRTPGVVIPPRDTVTINMYPDFSVNLLSSNGYCPAYVNTLLNVDSTSDHLLVENNLSINGFARNAVSLLRFDQLDVVPHGSTLLSAQLMLQADLRGHYLPEWPNANSVNPTDSVGFSLTGPAGWFPYQSLDTILNQAYTSPWYRGVKNIVPFQNDTVNVMDYLSGYLSGQYTSNTFVLTQGAGPLHVTPGDTCARNVNVLPPYLLGGYGNAYSTWYSRHYADSTKWPVMRVTYVLPAPQVDTMGAVLAFNSTESCNTIYGRSCYSSITDTLVNPYQFGILGNFRPDRSYVYYGRRTESNPSQPINIRTAGTISNFAPFWTLQSGRWLPSYDTTRWVWNSQGTLFNRKGFELENKDPLGRYNSGLYGYGLTLPVAVTQNSRYQESAYEGFEDYGFVPNSCDTVCAESRPFDFSAFTSNFSTAQAHTGLYSLQVPKGGGLSMTVGIQAAPDSTEPQLVQQVGTNPCLNESKWKGTTASTNTILPPFSPYAGKKMVIGAWVKEDTVCTCQAYTRNHIQLNFSLAGGGTSNLVLSPTGNMIEGWQRYETVVVIPSNTTGLTLILQASDLSTTYFDDIRIHPYNAEMKSFVYNAVNLRLMGELDENNYATFYEYDDDGTLIRVKKETEAGIQTIKETRSALLKNQ